jgi:hypothetical protein
MWSKQLTELSKSYFRIGGCNVKSENAKFGFLITDNEKHLYKITIFNLFYLDFVNSLIQHIDIY